MYEMRRKTIGETFKKLDDCPISEKERHILEFYGPEFNLPPKVLPWKEIITSVESSSQNLKPEEASSFKSEISELILNAKPQHHPLPKDLHKTLIEMKKNKNFVYGKFDKGTGMWRMEDRTYTAKCKEEFESLDSQGNPKYEKLNEDPTPKIINKITYRLDRSKADSNLKSQLN